MMFTIFTKKIIKLVAIALIVAVIGNSLIIPQARADIWGASILAAILDVSWTEIIDMIKGILIAAIKKAVLLTATQTLENVVTAGSLHSMLFISDWRDYLVTGPLKQASGFLNDFFILTSRGRSSLSNYKACGKGFQDATSMLVLKEGKRTEPLTLNDYLGDEAGNYYKYLEDRARNSTLDLPLPFINLPEISCDPFNLFAQDNWRAYNYFISQPANNPFGFELIAVDAFIAQKEEAKQQAATKATANQGMKGKEKKGFTITPARVVGDTLSSIKTLEDKFLAACQKPSDCIVEAISRIATKAIDKGMGDVQKKVQKQINNQIIKSSKSLDAKRADLNPKQQTAPAR